ncbi:MAG: methylmalonyl-CoA epimerase [Candidatus Cloacimonetes bacterium]|jgi:methylmalonyl-CoA/ethylmalonyl-CoA epimerase|nr:methylmalonyl-CoA epimerase [Candidatus Cloacimonadota bacterium]HOA29461.1 methylmalonyl-CoA epimerase [Candidatus Cloacimonadota bacterium]HOH59848.1 methylmalonyl-CoA epimerase [Candidatus Cloacimonadota bacterium]HPI25700.1 methylmalonyl-CoA epimerase [Candidatus Cloacimonadota bacterium]HQQ67915.1 methylmalonyl-CoA epimerase [Candidatus Cloacimonadota bacterium]
MIKHISHIGIAVKDLDEGIAFYQKLGLVLEGTEEVPSQMVKVAFFPVGDTRIELLAPTSEESPIAKFIEKKGEGIQHIAFAVEDLPQALKETEEDGIRLIDKEPRPGAHGADIAFLHPKSTSGVLIEFCKEKH